MRNMAADQPYSAQNRTAHKRNMVAGSAALRAESYYVQEEYDGWRNRAPRKIVLRIREIWWLAQSCSGVESHCGGMELCR